jgi:SpoVK/Ycf46/Vps4 family AAA+-type ATPase
MSRLKDMTDKEILNQDLMSEETLRLRRFSDEDIKEIRYRAQMILAREAREHEMRAEVKNTVEKLSRFVNNMSCPSRIFVEEVMKEHRTLQQSMFSLFLKCMEAWSKLPENHYDLRNEYTVKMSRKIMEAVEEDWAGEAPFI